MNNYFYGGYSDVGYQREINEDYISVIELDDTTLFAIMADGRGSETTTRAQTSLTVHQITDIVKRIMEHSPDMAYSNEDLFLREIQRGAERTMEESSGSFTSSLQPASIACSEMNEVIRRVFYNDKELLLEKPEIFLREAMNTANRVLGAFKKGNEELYSGFGVSVTCILMWENGNFSFAHTGDTRMQLIRLSKAGEATIMQLTQDHTRAKKLLDEGLIDLNHYHTHPDRLVLTSELGAVSDPEIQTYTGTIKQHDFLLLTTDGIHYAIQPQPMADFVVMSDKCDDAAQTLVKAAISQKYVDNMSALVIWRNK